MDAFNVLKEVFFVIGSLFGVAAFFGFSLKSIAEDNRQRWREVQKIVSDDDFREIQSCTYNSRRVPGARLVRIQRLVHDIREDADYLRFRAPFAGVYHKFLLDVAKKYEEYRNLVQVPWWNPERDEDLDDPHHDWVFDKKAFVGEEGYPKDYAPHIDDATNRAMVMRTAYKRLSVLSDLHPWELPLGAWLARRRARDTYEE